MHCVRDCSDSFLFFIKTKTIVESPALAQHPKKTIRYQMITDSCFRIFALKKGKGGMLFFIVQEELM